MATKKSISVFKRITKTEKGKPITLLQEVEIEGTLNSAKKAVAHLQKNKEPYFEVLDRKKGIKTTYTKTLSGKNYEVKVVKI